MSGMRRAFTATFYVARRPPGSGRGHLGEGRNVLGIPPPLPPPNVPDLDETGVKGSLRQRMELH